VHAVALLDREGGETCTVEAPYILDATELGDLLPMAGAEHVVGAESQAETGEPHALPGDADPLDQQAITACFAIDYLPDQDHTIDRPEDYDVWRTYKADFWPGPQLGWDFTDPVTLERRHQGIFEPDREGGDTLWTFRRIFFTGHYRRGAYPSDITLVNWPQNDYWLGPLVGVTEEERRRHLRGARQLSLSLLYWMQTEAPRHDGGYGYPGLRLRSDVVGSRDQRLLPDAAVLPRDPCWVRARRSRPATGCRWRTTAPSSRTGRPSRSTSIGWSAKACR